MLNSDTRRVMTLETMNFLIIRFILRLQLNGLGSPFGITTKPDRPVECQGNSTGLSGLLQGRFSVK